jgi:hypothetical protein
MCDSHPRTRKEVVGQRVAREAGEHGGDHQRHADDPVDLTWSPESAGEEYAQHMNHDRGHEDVCRPVVGLTHEEPEPDVEAQVEDGGVGLRHAHAAERLVGPVVYHLSHARYIEEREVDSCEDQDDERVEGDLAEQERPVIGKDLLELLPGSPSHLEALIEPPDDLRRVRRHLSRCQNDGPTGSAKSPRATRKPSSSIPMGS